MNERKCNECDEKASNHFEDKWYCVNHYSEARRESNKKYERVIFIKKCAIVGGGIIAIVAGTIVIYQFVTNL